MTDSTQPEALRLAELLELAPEDGVEPQTAEDAAAELRRLHTENTALQQGYAAARLEIESLQARIKTMAEEHADELMVAHLDGRMCAAQAAPQQEAQEPYSIDVDPQGIRALVADAITGALAFGAQGANPPPTGHWLAPFWEMAREEVIRAARAPADSVLEDAARYCYLRDVPMEQWPAELLTAIRLQQNAKWDTAIDAARKQGVNHD